MVCAKDKLFLIKAASIDEGRYDMQQVREPGRRVREDAHLQVLTRSLLHEVASDLDTYWGGGDISPSSYETAWVAMVRDPIAPGRLAFPRSLSCLIQTQEADGSWKPHFPHSILPTMAAALALARAPRRTPGARPARDRALGYLHRVLRDWEPAGYDTPLYEFLLPMLAGELEALGFRLRVPDLPALQERQRQKLERLPLELIYTGQSNLIHGLEALPQVLDYRRLRAVRSPEGSYGNSPSSTASVLIHGPVWDEKAAGWLAQLSRRAFGGIGGAMPTSFPADTFEVAWVLYFLLAGGARLDPKRNATHRLLLRWLQDCLSREGASFARLGSLPSDVDDTAMVLAVLNRSGIATPLDPLWCFFEGDHFVSYAGERTASTSANAHVLEALLSADLRPVEDRDRYRRHRRTIEKLVEYLLDTRETLGRSSHWVDKWHQSPYYATQSCVLALCRVPDPAVHQELRSTFGWLLESARPDGSWGSSDGGMATAEETAYGLLSLRALRHALPFYESERASMVMASALGRISRWSGLLSPRGETPPPSAVHHGSPGEDPLPALWVDKTPYAPARVIRAAMLGSLRY
jgi:halimadienyl-diphosphate synthase